MNTNEILKALFDLPDNDLRKVNSTTCQILKLRAKMKALEFQKGDRVSWLCKDDTIKSGVVTAVRGRNINVLVGGTKPWIVSAVLLTKI
jgi:hypothetical protein